MAVFYIYTNTCEQCGELNVAKMEVEHAIHTLSIAYFGFEETNLKKSGSFVPPGSK